MACFDDFVTVEGSCNDATPESGLTLKKVGLPISELNELVTDDYANGKALGEDKIDFAITLLTNEINQHFADKIRTNSVLENHRLGFTQENLSVEPGSKFKGINVELCSRDYVDFYLSELSLQLTTSGPVNVLVFDLLQNKLLDTLPITTVANEIVTIFPNKTYQSNLRDLHLAFIYDSTANSSIRTTLRTGCASCNTRLHRFNQHVRARAIKIDGADPKIDSNLEGIGDTGGMSLIYSINCNKLDWMCAQRDILGTTILYRAAFEIAVHALHIAQNQRTNTSVTINADTWNDRLAFYEMTWKNQLDSVLKRIRLPRGKCFECAIRSKQTVILP